MYEKYYDESFFGQEKIPCHYMDKVTKDTPILLSIKEKK